MRTRLVLSVLPLVLAACAPERPARAAGGPRNVVLICLDTVRADVLGCYGYETYPTTPAIDALAGEATVFEDCWSTACWTKPSVPSFLTGTFPLQHGVYEGSARSSRGAESDVLPDAATTLAEVFAAEDYDTAAFVRNAQLKLGMGLEQGFDVYLDRAGDAREIRWHATDWLDERPDDRPFFLYLHLLDAHWPYDVPDEYAARFTSPEAAAFFRADDWRGLRDSINAGTTQLDDEQVEALRALYAGSLRYIDDQLGRLFDTLEDRGLADDTVVCIVSDHGEEFLEHGRIGHGHGLTRELLQVPWILRVPGAPARRVAAPVSLVDLFPTLLAAAGVPHELRVAGVDRWTAADERAPLFAEHKTSGRYEQAWREGSAELVRELRAGTPAEERDADAPASIVPIEIGERYEVALRADDSDDLLVAVRVRPRPEEDADPVELKGVVRELAADRFTLAGVRVALDDETELYGETTTDAGTPRVLADGLPVKARGELVDGTLVCRKLKLYRPEDAELELRGVVTEASATRLVVGGLVVRLDERTELEATAASTDLTRDDIVAAVRALGAAEAPQGLAIASEAREIGAPGAPLAPELAERLRRALNAFGAEAVEQRVWAGTERRALENEDLDALRALGYVD